MITTNLFQNLPGGFTLTPDLEAHGPPEARGLRRDEVRLMVSHYGDDRVAHMRFTDFPAMLQPGDLVVANDSGTLPAALTAQFSDGRALALHLSTRLPDGHWVVEPRHVAVKTNDHLSLPDGGTARMLSPFADSHRLWIARLDLPMLFTDYLARWGRPIAYPYVTEQWPIEMYQTVYAAEPGSAEMPSAGRAFSPDVLERLAHRGIGFMTLTLDTGVASLELHERPYAEPFCVPSITAAAVIAARADNRRIVAVGTTVVRALESAADAAGQVTATSGWTDLVITPERGVKVIDALLTGFHEPEASHLAMLAAIAGRRHIERSYAAAIKERYLWHEFGDLHLILP